MQQKKRQKREERILSHLDRLNFATRKQLQVIENLGGDRNAQRVLKRMEKDRTLLSVRHEQKIYYLSNRGKERIGSNQSRLKRNKIKHTLMRNDLYIKLDMPSNWKNEVPINVNGKTLLIADAMYTKGKNYYFVEIDNVQTMRTNYDKIKKYKQLFDMILEQGKYPMLIWYTQSKIRKEKLEKSCKKNGVNYQIY